MRRLRPPEQQRRFGIGLKQTIFHQPWWLDAVAPDQWRSVSVDEGNRFAFSMLRR